MNTEFRVHFLHFLHTFVIWIESNLVQDGRLLPAGLTVVIGKMVPECPGSHSASTSVCISIADLVFRGGFIGKVTIVAELPTKTEF